MKASLSSYPGHPSAVKLVRKYLEPEFWNLIQLNICPSMGLLEFQPFSSKSCRVVFFRYGQCIFFDPFNYTSPSQFGKKIFQTHSYISAVPHLIKLVQNRFPRLSPNYSFVILDTLVMSLPE